MSEALHRAVLAEIEKDLSRWDQEEYVTFCGTTMCYGGWAMHLSGYEARTGWFRMSNDSRLRVPDVEVIAAFLLGIEPDDAHMIFGYFPEVTAPDDTHLCARDCSDGTGCVPVSKEEQFQRMKERVRQVTGLDL